MQIPLSKEATQAGPWYLKSLPRNATRRILRGTPRAPLFHALNQRVDHAAPRTVSTFHDLFVMTGEYSTAEFRARFAAQARGAAERSDMIIAVSQFTARQVEELLGVNASRIRVIPHGTRIVASSGVARQNLILTVGAIQKRKNIARLVKAFERTPLGWRLAIAGAPGGYGADTELLAVERSSRRRDIDVLGYVPAAELDALYERAGIFAFPSLDEGFGMPVLDAMAHGVPVLASRRSAIPEVAGEAAWFVDPENQDEISAALVDLAADPTRREDLARRGRDRAALFTWPAAVDQTWAVYESLT